MSDIVKRLARLEAKWNAADGWDKEAVALSVANTIERLSRGERSEIDPELEKRLEALDDRFFPKPKLGSVSKCAQRSSQRLNIIFSGP